MNLYFDNASTSFPKPKDVINSVNNFISNIGASSSRGYYKKSIESNRILFECRESISSLFNYNKCENIIFTYNATYAFNLILHSLINSNLFKNTPHILISHLDHNSTTRPLINLKNEGIISLDYINCTSDNFIDINDFIFKIKDNTKFLIISHMSNVLGNIQNLQKLSNICKNNNIHFIIDASQSAGLVNIDLSKIYFSALIFTGHKNLFSTQGIGGFIINDSLLKECNNFFLGGTGSESSNLISKANMPDYFEVGTHNMVGICSLLSGINFINKTGLGNIFNHKKQILKNIYDEIKNINDIIVLNNVNIEDQNSTLCINIKNISSDKAAFILDKYFNICVRVGLHCAPNTHKILNTYPHGCIRISPSIFNSKEDINFLISSLYKITKKEF